MKCDICKFKTHYNTGADEYPAYTTIHYCYHGYWSDDYEPEPEETIMIWENCKSFVVDPKKIKKERENKLKRI